MTSDGNGNGANSTPDYEYTDGVKWYSSAFNSAFGRFTIYGFEFPDGREHVVLAKGSVESADRPLVRVQSSCITGTAFLAHLCDCRQQLHLALETIQNEEAGLVVYLDQEGRGFGLVEKLAQLSLITGGLDTHEAALARGFTADPRSWEQAAWIVRQVIGDRPVRILSNNPKKIDGLREHGVEVETDVRLQTEPTPTNYHYLRVKRDKMGHILPALSEPEEISEMAVAV